LLALDPAKVDLDDLRQGVARVRAALNVLIAAIEENVAAQIAAVRTGLDGIDDAATDTRSSDDARVRTTRDAVTQAGGAVTQLVADTRRDCP
jgi:phage host-nuclease inhibitor protein Gam